MTRLIIPALVALLVSGCGSGSKWQKMGATNNEFIVQSAQCQGLANGAAPMVDAPAQPATYTHSGTVTTPYGTSSYQGTSTPGPNYEALGASIANLGSAIQRDRIYNACMNQKGWRKFKEECPLCGVNEESPKSVSSMDINEAAKKLRG
jgi:hypothetical protein